MQFDEDSILFNGVLTSLTYPVFLPLTNVNIEDDTGCQPLTSIPVKNGASGPTGKHSLELNSVLALRTNQAELKSSKEAPKIS